jgi:hypothetical protein
MSTTEIHHGQYVSNSLLELKHSIKIHMLIMAGPSQQLCAFLIKTIDLLEDEDQDRKQQETLQLAFNIIEAVAIHVQQSIDSRAKQAKEKSNPMPEHIRINSDNILITLGRARGHDDKRAAKNAILASIAKALDDLSTFTGSGYPVIFDADGNILSQRSAA